MFPINKTNYNVISHQKLEREGERERERVVKILEDSIFGMRKYILVLNQNTIVKNNYQVKY